MLNTQNAFFGRFPRPVQSFFPANWEDCRPLTRRAWEELEDLAEKRIEVIDPSTDLMQELEKKVEDRLFDALFDGLLGMQAKLPPLEIQYRILLNG